MPLHGREARLGRARLSLTDSELASDNRPQVGLVALAREHVLF